MPRSTPAATLDPPDTDEAVRHEHADHHPKLEYVQLSGIDRSRNHRVPRPGDEQRILALMDSIAAGGQLSPVRVYEKPRPLASTKDYEQLYVLGFGWRRCEAMERLGMLRVRAEIFPPAADHEIEAARAIENLHRQDITPVEEAQAVADILAAYAQDHPAASRAEAIEHAAAETGRSPSWVRDRDYFARLSDQVRQFAVRVNLPAGHLREIAKVGDPELQFKIACRAVHAWPSDFKPGTIQPRTKDDAKDVEDLFARSAEGARNIERLDRVKQWVDESQRSLRSVPWLPTLPVLVKGKGGLPACDECPHNTANELTLFGVDANDDARVATCMNPACFEMKKAASEAERDRAAKAYLRLKQPTAKKLAAKVEAAPGWLDKKKLKGYLQRAAKKAAEQASGGIAPATGKRNASGQTPPGVPQAIDRALDAYGGALEAWCETAMNNIRARIEGDTVRRAGVLLLCQTQALQQVDQARPRVPYSWSRRQGKHQPQPAGPVPGAMLPLLKAIEAGKADQVVNIADAELMTKADPFALDYFPEHPEFMLLLMEAVGINIIESDQPPTWEQFKPQAEAAPKKKAAKKTVKKKATAGGVR
ncbi:MAG: ParB N-terminal domain-containing protein [Planctomycetota bacterium]